MSSSSRRSSPSNTNATFHVFFSLAIVNSASKGWPKRFLKSVIGPIFFDVIRSRASSSVSSWLAMCFFSLNEHSGFMHSNTPSVCLCTCPLHSGQGACRFGKTRLTFSSVYCLVCATMPLVKSTISFMKTSLLNRPASISFSLNSHSPVISGEPRVVIPISSSRSTRAIPLLDTTSSRLFNSWRNTYFCRIRFSIIAARVAGVPNPRSLIASRSSSSSTRLPAVSIAESSVLSLKRAGGLVSLARNSTFLASADSPSATKTSSSLSAATPAVRP